VDLDYKALSNAGTWFVGKLQTERDKARLLEGLETVAAEQGTLTDRSYLETVISSLGNRLFLLHDVHRPRPLLFQSRWALSFLRGPMTREQVAKLMEPVKQQARLGAPLAIPLCTWCHAELGPDVTDRCPNPACGKNPWANAQFRLQDKAFRDTLTRASASAALPAAVAGAADSGAGRLAPVLPPDVTQFYVAPLPGRSAPAGAELEYQPRLLGFGEVAFVVDKRKGREHVEKFQLLAEPPGAGRPPAWDRAEAAGPLAPGPLPDARWADVPESLNTGRKLKSLEKGFADYLYSTQKLALFENRALELVSEPGESRDAFRGRCRAAARLRAEQALDMEKLKFTPKFEALGIDLPDEPAGKSAGSWLDWVIPFRSAPAKPAPGPAASRQEEKERKLTADYLAKKAELAEKWKRIGDEATPIQVKPRKVDVRVTQFGLAWVPCWRTARAGKVVLTPAHR
jgi:hypothetical protein